MRVSISYTLDFEKIPNEVTKFIQELRKKQHKLQFLNDETVEKLEEQDTATALQKIELIRKELVEVDSKLQDSAGILEGYHKALLDIAAQQVEAQAKAESPPSTPPEESAEPVEGGPIEEG